MKKIRLRHYFSMVKFAHTVFALPFALIGFFLAIAQNNIRFEWAVFVSVLACMVFARNAAMGFNRYLDRRIDARNPRTAKREVPAGIIKPQFALLFVIINSLLFVATTFFINRLVFFLSPVALLVILGYSYTKRFTSLCHFVLGLGLSLAPIGAYLSVTGRFDWLPLFYSFVVLFWVSGFDIIYALQDIDFDKHENLKSVPVRTGRRNALILSSLLHFLSAALVIIAGLYAAFGWIYWLGAAIFIALLVYQHTIVKPNDLRRVNKAFFTTNGFASVIFCVFTLADLFL